VLLAVDLAVALLPIEPRACCRFFVGFFSVGISFL